MARLSSIVFIICLLLCNNAISNEISQSPPSGDTSLGSGGGGGGGSGGGSGADGGTGGGTDLKGPKGEGKGENGSDKGDGKGKGQGSQTDQERKENPGSSQDSNSLGDQVPGTTGDSASGSKGDKESQPAPKEPAPTTPKEPAPTTPKEPAPTTPKEPEPTTPKEPEPTTPKEPVTKVQEQQESSEGSEDPSSKIPQKQVSSDDPGSPTLDNPASNTVGKKELSSTGDSLPSSEEDPGSPKKKNAGEEDPPSLPKKGESPPAKKPEAPPAKPAAPESLKVSKAGADLNSQKQGQGIRGKRALPPQPQVPPVNDITDMESYLLKNYDGVKVIGLCGVYFRVQFSPHLLLYGLTKFSIIQIEPFFERVRIDFEHQHPIKNKCAPGKAFAFISYIKDNILTLKWKVFTPPSDLFANDEVKDKILSNVPEEPNTEEESPVLVDVRKYRLPQLERPFTSIQVYKANTKQGLLETKNYILKNAIPEKCSKISMDCFLNGNVNIENCFKCTLLVQNAKPTDECFQYLPSDMKNNLDQIKISGQSDEDTKENDLIESIEILLNSFYKVDKKTKKMSLITMDDFDDVLRTELFNYCKLLKELDTKKTLENAELGNEIDIFNNMLRLLKTNEGETKLNLYKKLRNTAICLKDVNTWAEKKRGLILPEELTQDQMTEGQNEEPNDEDPDDRVDLLELFDDNQDENIVDKDGIIDMSMAIKYAKLKSPYFTSSKYCNYEYCDRWQDKTSCISNIDVEEQGNCSLCWLFASKLHIETIRCMRGYGHNRASALYVANCSERTGEEVCNDGSNPLEFLKILEKNKFLPLESNYPYLWKNVSGTCPNPQNDWTNLWGNTKLLYNNMYGQFIKHRGYIVYNSRFFAKNMDVFIDIVKREIRNKGSVIAYIKTQGVIDYDFNGRYISNICGHSHPDHAVNIIGYGNYISDNGEKRSYWLIRNSWGYYWGHEGNFKVDVLGPDNCVHNVIHTAIVFKIDMEPDNDSNNNASKNDDQLVDESDKSYFPQLSSNFYHSLYYNNFEGYEAKNDDENDQNYDKVDVSGQSDDPQGDLQKGKTQTDPQKPQADGIVTQPEASLASNPGTTGSNPTTQNPDGSSSTVADTANPNTTVTETPGVTTSAATASIEKKIQILHVLKHIENYKMTRGLVKYDNLNDTKSDYACARSYAYDPKNHNECKQFCEENWERCKDHYSPGYCLTTLSGKNKCLFCYV
ncbi:hypothetical protein YYC_04927 [Plasmodium yoelii 17X]|uniref:Peptidase C1A papain C-terminal domain-containing protein n=1 Tax=Plasmodium yoelii 17X TaxID=1323249 RepID=V7PEC8_PLAYE|nr:hypothetical protein YYC_04927 [Plasmodium yoelii 17X]